MAVNSIRPANLFGGAIPAQGLCQDIDKLSSPTAMGVPRSRSRCVCVRVGSA